MSITQMALYIGQITGSTDHLACVRHAEHLCSMRYDYKERDDKVIPEHEIIRRCYAELCEGAKNRRDGTRSRYHPRTLFGMLNIYGWVREDLRLALCRFDSSYAKYQTINPMDCKMPHSVIGERDVMLTTEKVIYAGVPDGDARVDENLSVRKSWGGV